MILRACQVYIDLAHGGFSCSKLHSHHYSFFVGLANPPGSKLTRCGTYRYKRIKDLLQAYQVPIIHTVLGIRKEYHDRSKSDVRVSASPQILFGKQTQVPSRGEMVIDRDVKKHGTHVGPPL